MKKQKIALFVDIIDNYGDMGWVLECMIMSGLDVFFSIVTDSPNKMKEFLEKSGYNSDNYEILEKSVYDYHQTPFLVILVLHTKVDFHRFPRGTHILRINYLSYDPWYRNIDGSEYILSTRERPIIECCYSPLLGTGGVWHYDTTHITRDIWLKTVGFPDFLMEKVWIVIFCYEDALRNFSQEEDDNDEVVVFFIGDIPSGFMIPSGAYHLPWLSRDAFWSLIDLSDISLLRGEVSSIRGLMSGKPLLWDMYKKIGGWNRKESDEYLDFIRAGKEYREIHNRINDGGKWSKKDILNVREVWKEINTDAIPNFRKTLEKNLDKLGISL